MFRLPALPGALRALQPRQAAVRALCVSGRSHSEFDDLKKALENPQTKRNVSTVFDIDELIANSPGLQDTQSNKYDAFSFGNEAKDPREVAKSINIMGPTSGRSVDVKYNNVGMALGNMYGILRANDVKHQWHQQKRYIRPAKLQKEKHRRWWKKQFSKNFSNLMSQITDAKRRGY